MAASSDLRPLDGLAWEGGATLAPAFILGLRRCHHHMSEGHLRVIIERLAMRLVGTAGWRTGRSRGSRSFNHPQHVMNGVDPPISPTIVLGR